MTVNNSSKKESLNNNKSKKNGPDFNGIDLLLRNLKGLGSPYKEVSNLFSIKPANEWKEEAKRKPLQKKLFGSLFFENELCILFADTNLGKSVFIHNKDKDDFLTVPQTMELFKCSRATLNNWRSKGILIPKVVEGRVYYLKSDCIKALHGPPDQMKGGKRNG